MVKICEECHRAFSAINAKCKYCSDECRKKHFAPMQEKYYQIRKEKEKAKTALGIRKCRWCYKEFQSSKGNHVFCSKTCSSRYKALQKYRGEMSKEEWEALRNKKCKVCGKEFRSKKDKTIICNDCKKKYGLTTADVLPNQCAWCGAYIREHKAVCKKCYEKAPEKYEKKMVDFT